MRDAGVHGACAEMMNIMFWMTPAGTLDEGGVLQPAYLNFRQHLLQDPASPESFKARPARRIMRCNYPLISGNASTFCRSSPARRASRCALPAASCNLNTP